MAQYLRSQTTGVVLSYNKELATRPNVELMTEEECAEYEASVQARLSGTADVHPDVVVPTTTVEPKPVVEPAPVPEPEPEPEPELTAKELLGALEVD